MKRKKSAARGSKPGKLRQRQSSTDLVAPKAATKRRTAKSSKCARGPKPHGKSRANESFTLAIPNPSRENPFKLEKKVKENKNSSNSRRKSGHRSRRRRRRRTRATHQDNGHFDVQAIGREMVAGPISSRMCRTGRSSQSPNVPTRLPRSS